jgi:hypothetical protein
VERGGGNALTSRNQWRQLVSNTQDTSSYTPIGIEQDANMFVMMDVKSHPKMMVAT